MSRPMPSKTTKLSGLRRSAALMRQLGDHSDAVWAQLSPDETARLKSAMTETSSVPAETEVESLFLQQMSAGSDHTAKSGLADLPPERAGDLVAFASAESPQIMALVLSSVREETAAALVQALPKPLAIQALHRLMHMQPSHPSAMAALEAAFSAATAKASPLGRMSGPDRLAEIMNRIDSRLSPSLMAGLDEIEAGSGDRIRRLMFTFDDLAGLDPASLQTLLAHIHRTVLITALQSAADATAGAFFKNMTQRAADVLKSEIETSGPFSRTDIEQARQDIAGLARKLARRGEMLTASGFDEELME